MFRLCRLTSAEIDRQIELATELPAACSRLLAQTDGLLKQPPGQFAHDRTRSCIGSGRMTFLAAKKAFADWTMFDLGWVRVANPHARIVAGAMIGVEARTMGLWTFNLSRIVEFVDRPNQFAFVYATTECHVEHGEERFLLEFDPATGEVWYDLESVSRPGVVLARIGLPLTRIFQHKFARDSHRRMRQAVSSTEPDSPIHEADNLKL